MTQLEKEYEMEELQDEIDLLILKIKKGLYKPNLKTIKTKAERE